jgi:hypothetical protein
VKVYLKGGTEKTVIMAVREALVQPFDAGQWLDLRVAFFLSVCGGADPAGDDTITGLGETLVHPVGPISDYFFIGLKDKSTLFPAQNGSVFIGYTNMFGVGPTGKGDSDLVTSDLAIGTTNADYWRPKNSNGDIYTAQIYDGIQFRGGSGINLNTHFVQQYIPGGHAAGYATLLMMRITRPSPTSTVVTVSMKSGANSTDVLFSSTPTKAILESNMESFPSTVYQFPAATLSAVPDSLFCYWPWHNSRLRIHCAGVEVIA